MPSKIVKSFGEEVTVHFNEAGDYFCPVCGLLWKNTSGLYPTGFLQSMDDCPRCDTQLGNEDIDEVPASPDNPAEKRWGKLREAWLERNGWDPLLIKEVEDHLGVKVERPSNS